MQVLPNRHAAKQHNELHMFTLPRLLLLFQVTPGPALTVLRQVQHLPDAHIVLLTGRSAEVGKAVRTLCAEFGCRFDEYIFKPGPGTRSHHNGLLLCNPSSSLCVWSGASSDATIQARGLAQAGSQSHHC